MPSAMHEWDDAVILLSPGNAHCVRAPRKDISNLRQTSPDISDTLKLQQLQMQARAAPLMTSSARCATKSGMGAGLCTAFRRTPLRPLAHTPGGFSAATRYDVISGPSTCRHSLSHQAQQVRQGTFTVHVCEQSGRVLKRLFRRLQYTVQQ